VLTLEDVPQAIVDPVIKIRTSENETRELKLAGVVYFGQEHFTARVVDRSQRMWYHDGLTTRRNCVDNGQLNQISYQDLWFKEGRKASAIIYSLIE